MIVEPKKPVERYLMYLLVLLILATLLFFAPSCTLLKPYAPRAFDLLKELSEKKLKQLLQAEYSFTKDSTNISVIVPREHTRKVLGKKLAIWFTREGEAVLSKQDLYLRLSWKPKDSALVMLKFERYKIE